MNLKFLIFKNFGIFGIFIGNPIAQKYEEIMRNIDTVRYGPYSYIDYIKRMKSRRRLPEARKRISGHCPDKNFSNHGDYWIYRKFVFIFFFL